MQLKFLGSGSAFCVQSGNYQSNLLLTSESGKRLLIDCGSDIRCSLAEAGLSYRDIDDIYISHLHADHVGGLEFMGLSTMFDDHCGMPGLYISESIRDELWNNTLSGGMSATDEKLCVLSDYFRVHDISARGSFVWEGVTFEMVETDHILGKQKSMSSFGLFFTVASTTVYLTTDTRFAPDRLRPYFQQADLILHDCETSPSASGVHARFEELQTLPASIRAKMWLYHFDDGPLPDARAAGFCGFVGCGQFFELAG